MTTFSTLTTYALTVQPPSATQQAIVGDFTGVPKAQQILTASGSRLSLFELERGTHDLVELHTHDVFGIIRGIALYRLAGQTKGE